MPHIELRLTEGSTSPEDLRLSVQDKTFEYLMSTQAAEIRVSAYFDEDTPRVELRYAELFLGDECPNVYLIAQTIPGSRTRKRIPLPGPMSTGEQLTVVVKRKGAEPAERRD